MAVCRGCCNPYAYLPRSTGQTQCMSVPLVSHSLVASHASWESCKVARLQAVCVSGASLSGNSFYLPSGDQRVGGGGCEPIASSGFALAFPTKVVEGGGRTPHCGCRGCCNPYAKARARLRLSIIFRVCSALALVFGAATREMVGDVFGACAWTPPPPPVDAANS